MERWRMPTDAEVRQMDRDAERLEVLKAAQARLREVATRLGKDECKRRLEAAGIDTNQGQRIRQMSVADKIVEAHRYLDALDPVQGEEA